MNEGRTKGRKGQQTQIKSRREVSVSDMKKGTQVNKTSPQCGDFYHKQENNEIMKCKQKHSKKDV